LIQVAEVDQGLLSTIRSTPFAQWATQTRSHAVADVDAEADAHGLAGAEDRPLVNLALALQVSRDR